MELKTIKFTETNQNGQKFNVTLHNFPVYSEKEIEEMKKKCPKLYQMLLASLIKTLQHKKFGYYK